MILSTIHDLKNNSSMRTSKCLELGMHSTMFLDVTVHYYSIDQRILSVEWAVKGHNCIHKTSVFSYQ